MRRRILAILHRRGARTGLLGDKLEQRGYELRRIYPLDGDPLPRELDHYAAGIVFGGMMGANDAACLPPLRAELEWIVHAIASEIRLCGICLGAQLLARALGASVAPHSEGLVEAGYYLIRPTTRANPIFVEPMHVYQWHRDGFSLPDGSELLAQGEVFANQAFRYGRAVYGFQFHPEIDHNIIEIWSRRSPEMLTAPGAKSANEHLFCYERYRAANERWLEHFLDYWLDSA